MATQNDNGLWSKARIERGIYKRMSPTGEVRYFATVRTRRGTASGTFTTISKARDFIAKSKRDMVEGRFFGDMAGAKIGVADAVEQFLREKNVTHKTQRARCQWWADRFKDLPVLELDAERVSEALGDLAATGISGSTVNRYHAALSGMWKHWSQFRAGSPALVPQNANPARAVAYEPPAEERVFTLAKPQRDALLAACAGDAEMLAAVRLSLTSGCRYGELCALKWRDVNLTARTATLHRTKNGERRPIAFDEATVTAFKALPRGIAAAAVFSERVTKYSSQRVLWAAVTKQAGLSGMRWHDMRHVSVQLAIESGSTLMEAGLHTGHKSFAALKRYSALDATHQQRIAARVGEAL